MLGTTYALIPAKSNFGGFMRGKFLFLIFVIALMGCSKQTQNGNVDIKHSDALYSLDGREHQVSFEALYKSSYKSLEEIRPQYLPTEIKRTTQFLFGPLVQRSLGGIQKGEKIQPLIEKAYVQNEKIIIPFLYTATWLIRQDVVAENSLQLPLPYSIDDLETPKWKRCTDSQEGHNTWSFFWYYWDPERYGCDHKIGTQYQIVQVKIGQETVQTQTSYPEYRRLIRDENGVPTLAMTFAFGYVEDNNSPDPFKDYDYGMTRFQEFYEKVKVQLSNQDFKEQAILQKDVIKGSGNTVIGSQFTGFKDGVRIRVSIVASAGVDQMDLFAHSFANQHEGFFGWFGHSRVGSGFDAERFAFKLRNNPRQYSMTSEYQLIYWAGCNSYSYYTLPFFELKAKMNPDIDFNGTQNLDLISNALPSLFSFNDYNADVLFQALMNWRNPTSYQVLVDDIENHAKSSGYEVMVNVLGDEDNPLLE